MQALRENLRRNLTIKQIREIYVPIQGNEAGLTRLYALLRDTDKKVAQNALWVMTHFTEADTFWLLQKYDELLATLFATQEAESGKRRMILSILAKQNYTKENLRTDFLNYCLEHMCMPQESVANRCLAMHLAYVQACLYPELCTELLQLVEDIEPTDASIICTKKNILKRIHKQLISQHI